MSVTLLSSLVLVSSGNIIERNNEKENVFVTSSTDVSESPHMPSIKKNDQEYLRKANRKLEEEFNSDGKTYVKATINSYVLNVTSDEIHSEIMETVVDYTLRQLLKDIPDSINSNKATEEYKTIIYKIQVCIEEEAKTLRYDNDIITFIQNGNNLTIAKSNKVKNIIPLVILNY